MYKFGKKIGSGSWGEVFTATNSFGLPLAIKKIPKSKMSPKKLQKEVRAAKRARLCGGVAYFHESYEDEENYFLVFDFVEGKDLLKIITEAKFVPFKEDVAKIIFGNLVRSLIQIHSMRIVHHDLKLENVLLNPNTLETNIIDFGLADILPEDSSVTTGDPGSYEYLGPEKIFSEKKTGYDGFKSDIWSLGIMLYAMTYAQFPWSKKERQEFIERNRTHPPLKIPSDRTRVVSADCKDLIAKILTPDVKERISLEDILNHPWLSQEGGLHRSFSVAQY